MAKKLWKIIDHSSSGALELSRQLGVSPLMGQLLWNRGITEPEQAQAFLVPEWGQLHDPFLFQQMPQAVARLRQALAEQQRVLIYGDYDVDGVTAIALVVRVLAKYLPGRIFYYIPKRLEEGYGMHLNSLEKAIAKGVDLVVTVDCGVSALPAGAFLRSQGIDLIITDHHEPGLELPEALAIINPKLSGSGYPFTQLAGVGVAFKLLQGLAREIPELEPALQTNLDLVALGTVADIVPLLEENRVLVKYGLEQLARTENIGIQALVETAGLSGRELNCGHISYLLAPRINAAGRMGASGTAVKLFLTGNPIQALDYARQLERDNQARQETENRVLLQAQALLESEPELLEQHALVLAGEGWHPGVIGIVASKLVELYAKPVLLIGFEGDQGRGSGRSIAGFNLFAALEQCQPYLLRFGGHEFAAGFSVERSNWNSFRDAFLHLAKEKLSRQDLSPVLQIESLIELSHVQLELVRELSRLAPYGTCNPTPILGCQALQLLDYKNVGENGKHLKLKVRADQVVREGIGFNLGRLATELAGSNQVDLAFFLEENQWNGATQVQLNLKDIAVRPVRANG